MDRAGDLASGHVRRASAGAATSSPDSVADSLDKLTSRYRTNFLGFSHS